MRWTINARTGADPCDLKTGACLNVPERCVKIHRTRVRDGQVQICLGGAESGAGRPASE